MNYTLATAEDVLAGLGASQQGLSDEEVAARRAEYGFNELPKKKRSLILLFLRQWCDVMVYILLGALALSIVLPFLESETVSIQSFFDAIAILTILLLNAVLGFVQEYRAEEAISMLQKLTSPSARVRRGGAEVIVPSRELVPGDIVILTAGDKVSADGRILSSAHLRVNESSLTGESGAVDKKSEALQREVPLADQENMVFAGTIATRGSCEYVVTSIGTETEIGKIAKLVAETEIPETPLEKRMQRLGKLIGLIVIVLCAVVIGIGILQGRELTRMLLVGVSLAVSAVPEGLPAVVTVCLAMGVRRMVKRNALVRRLDALETLGSVTVICADKTGTITQNKMTVVETWLPEGEGASLLDQICASCNRAQLPDIGDPTEVGLLEFAAGKGAERLPIVHEEIPFTSEVKYMQTRHDLNGETVSFLKGAPEKIATLCTEGEIEAMLKRDDELADQGLRVLACAVKEGEEIRPIGLVAMEDPPRETAKASIEEAKRAGIRTIMITGDNILTAKTIAEEVGITGEAMRGSELDHIHDAELKRRMKATSIFARVSPEHKLRILEALQAKGEIVAMSGDGVNDAPALKGAHVGVAMGKIGTEVAREASSIVLADDHYSTIVAAIREGRRIYDNIRKFVLFLLRANFDEILFISVTLFAGMPLPYLPLHILLINLMTDGLPALALGMEKAEPDIMDRPPRPKEEHILSGEWGRLVIAGLLGFAVSFAFFFWMLQSGVELTEARTAAVVLAINFELFMVFTMRSARPLWTIGIFSNRWLVGAVTIPFLLQLILLYSPLAPFVHFVPLTLSQWGVILLICLGEYAFFECLKFLPQKAGLNRRSA